MLLKLIHGSTLVCNEDVGIAGSGPSPGEGRAQPAPQESASHHGAKHSLLRQVLKWPEGSKSSAYQTIRKHVRMWCG